MLDQIKCECGHANPPGTEICESCGKPFDGSDDWNKTLNMRYEGAARRSQTHTATVIDHIWHFFSSVKYAVWMIVITLIASMFGTIYPQQLYIPSNVDPYVYYQEEYGQLGYVYVLFGFHNLYSSWWYILLLTMIGISLVICSIDRVVPLYRSLKRQRVTKHTSFLKRQRISGHTEVEDHQQVFSKAKQALKEKGYRVRAEEHALMGEKGRFSRWGPYVNHVGLIIFLIAILIRILPGFTVDEDVWVRDGETVPVLGTDNYYVESKGFYLETYEDGDFPALEDVRDNQLLPKEFRTEAVLYEQIENPQTGEKELQQVAEHSITVNDPLVHDGLKLFQANYRLNEFSEFSFDLVDTESQEALGNMSIDLHDPQPTYEFDNDMTVHIIQYFPDFVMGDDGEPTTRSSVPNNPSFIFEVVTPENPDGERSWVFLGKTVVEPGADNRYELKLSDVKLNSVSGLLVRQDVSIPYVIVGGIIVMIGLVMGFYWQHRRIWLQADGQNVWIAAHTNKNWFGLNNEVSFVVDRTGIPIDKDALDKEAKHEHTTD
ncbi:cytochrome c biogenesis protein ResB [Caldalkalibacillus salinus]|uniref:cytochrome c biogenesis protein ResB n=1 Tax=Caldalkalibacillus salinus TaxID=2803787 RepID=UPI001921CD25